MTEDQKRQQKAELLLEYQEQENDLAHLREKLKKETLRIGTVIAWLRDYEFDPQSPSVERERRHQQIRTDSQLPISFDIAQLIELVDSIREGNSKLSELRQRKAALGLR